MKYLCFFMLLLSAGAMVQSAEKSIKIGILHSLSGTMAISERSVVDATLLAIDELNQAGGVLGQQLVAIVKDGASDWPTFAKEAEVLLRDDRVAVVFGCWTSASRKRVKPVFEQYDGLLFYPVQYEGIESSPNIVYTGAAPNQQLLPAVTWSINQLGIDRFFLVGSDYIFPRAANAILKLKIHALGGKVVGEEYLLLGTRQVSTVIKKIRNAGKGVAILNTINGDTNISFFNFLNEAGINATDNPVVSFSIGEPELMAIGAKKMAGHYAAWNYFQAIDSEQNRDFVRAMQAKYGSETVTSDPMEAAYVGVKLWAKAVEQAQSFKPSKVRRHIDQSYLAPQGPVRIDKKNQHLWKTARIGKILPSGQFEIIWQSSDPIRPDPYPIYRTKASWHQFIIEIYNGWGQQWANPG